MISGGDVTGLVVTQYWEDGRYEELEQLNHNRHDHGCASYQDDQQNNVLHKSLE